jgi:hypothetical protein
MDAQTIYLYLCSMGRMIVCVSTGQADADGSTLPSASRCCQRYGRSETPLCDGIKERHDSLGLHAHKGWGEEGREQS